MLGIWGVAVSVELNGSFIFLRDAENSTVQMAGIATEAQLSALKDLFTREAKEDLAGLQKTKHWRTLLLRSQIRMLHEVTHVYRRVSHQYCYISSSIYIPTFRGYTQASSWKSSQDHFLIYSRQDEDYRRQFHKSSIWSFQVQNIFLFQTIQIKA